MNQTVFCFVKVDRLIELHFKYWERVQACDTQIEKQKNVR